MRIRTIKPEFWRSDDIAALSIEDRLLFIGLWSYVEDNGVGRDECHLIAADLFAADMYRDPRETVARIERGLSHLSEAGLIVRYVTENRGYIEITSWKRHQKVDRPGKSSFPPYNADLHTLAKDSRDPHEGLAPGTGNREQGTGNREQGITPPLTSFAAPSRDEHTGDAQETPSKPKREPRGTRIPDDWQPSDELWAWTWTHAPAAANHREIEQFRDYWAQQTGQKARKADWNATWRTWARRTQENAENKPKTPRNQDQIMSDIYTEAAAHTAMLQASLPALTESSETA